MSLPTPTATDSPGRFWSESTARTICRARPTAAAHCGDGSDCTAEGAFCGSGCSGSAVAHRNAGNAPNATISATKAKRTMTKRRRMRFERVDTQILYIIKLFAYSPNVDPSPCCSSSIGSRRQCGGATLVGDVQKSVRLRCVAATADGLRVACQP